MSALLSHHTPSLYNVFNVILPIVLTCLKVIISITVSSSDERPLTQYINVVSPSMTLADRFTFRALSVFAFSNHGYK